MPKGSPRAIWTGSLSFGLVVFPIKVYKATDELGSETALNELHVTCNHPVTHKHFCAHCNAEFDYSQVVKGAKQDDGTFVLLTKDDIATIKPESSDMISISSFTQLQNIDPIYFRETYFISPDASAEPYALLRDVLTSEDVVGQGRWTIYGREHNIAVRATREGLVVHMLRTVSEVRDQSVLPGCSLARTVQVNPGVRKMLDQLVRSMESDFDASAFEDGYAKDFKALVAAKKSGKPLAASAKKLPASVSNLMSALSESLKTIGAPKSRRKAS